MLRGLELVEDERVGSAARDRRRFASAEAENGKRRRRRSGAGGRAGCAEPRRRLRRCCCGSMTRRRHCCRRRQRRRRSARRRHLFGEENRETDLSWKEEKMKNRQAQTEKIKLLEEFDVSSSPLRRHLSSLLLFTLTMPAPLTPGSFLTELHKMFERTKAKGAISLTTSRSKKERVDWVCDRPFLDLDRSPGKTPFFLSRLHETNPENDHTPTFHSQPQEQEHAKSRPGESKGGAKERDEGKARERKTRRVPLLSPPSTPLISLPLSLFDSPPESHAYPRTHKTGRAERLPRQGLGRKEEDHDDGERKKSVSFFISVCYLSRAHLFFSFPSSIKTKSNSKGLHERLPTLR